MFGNTKCTGIMVTRILLGGILCSSVFQFWHYYDHLRSVYGKITFSSRGVYDELLTSDAKDWNNYNEIIMKNSWYNHTATDVEEDSSRAKYAQENYVAHHNRPIQYPSVR